MGSFEIAGQDLLLVEKAEALVASATISEDDRYLIGGLRSYHIGDRRTRNDLGRETSSHVAAESASFYCLPDAVRERVIAILAAHGPATQASE